MHPSGSKRTIQETLGFIKNMKHTLIIFLFTSLLSCSNFLKKYEVLIFNNDLKDIDLLIDGNKIFIDSLNQFTKLNLKKGIHKIESEKIFPDSINIDNDILITRSDRRFVQFPIYYENKQGAELITVSYPSGPIVLDNSIVIYDSQKFNNVDELIKGINAFEDFERIRIKKGYSKTNPNKKPRLRLITPTKNIILKSWLYTIQDLPNEIEVKKTITNEILGVSKSIGVITNFENFLSLSTSQEIFKAERVSDSIKLAKIKSYLKKRYDIQ